MILNKKTGFFLTESKERHLNLKRAEITLYMKGASPPPQRPPLLAKVFYFFKK